MTQADLGLNLTTKRTRKRAFLAQLESVVPWSALVQRVSPHAPQGKSGRPPFPEEAMLRVHFMLQGFTLISAPSSTKNASGARDPAMKQSKKGNPWHFGMKAHIGVDAESGLVHTVIETSGNVNDVVPANGLLHGEEETVFAGRFDECFKVAG